MKITKLKLIYWIPVFGLIKTILEVDYFTNNYFLILCWAAYQIGITLPLGAYIMINILIYFNVL